MKDSSLKAEGLTRGCHILH